MIPIKKKNKGGVRGPYLRTALNLVCLIIYHEQAVILPCSKFHPVPRVHVSYYNLSSVCLSVCLSVCSLSPPRSFDGSSPNLVGVCRWTSELPLRGSFSKRSTGRRVTFAFHYIIYAPASRHTAAKGTFCFAGSAAESNSAPFAPLHVNGVCRWTSQLLLRGSFSKRSTGRRVNGSLSLSLYYI